jgi:SAM-dependent methyltransferase
VIGRRTPCSIAAEADALYRNGSPKWDIGGPQEPVKRLAAMGAFAGEVLDAGCGLGWHAILLASTGLSVTAVDTSALALNQVPQDAGVQFVQGDATALESFDRFDSVLDSAFYHTFVHEPDIRVRYAQTLRRVTRPGAKLFLFGFAPGHINGFTNPMALSENDFRPLEDVGFRTKYLGKTTYQLRVDRRMPQFARWPDERVHVPMWELHAERDI